MKKVVLIRSIHESKQTLGHLFVLDGTQLMFKCKTLELPYNDNIRNLSSVPSGLYPLHYEYSPKFDRALWELKNVPNRSECKIHVANYVRQLNGCIALGDMHLDIDGDGQRDVRNSTLSLQRFHESMESIRFSEIQIIDI